MSKDRRHARNPEPVRRFYLRRTGSGRGLAAALALLLAALPVTLAAGTDRAALARMAALAPSERLQAYALARGLAHDRRSVALSGALRRALTGLAFYHEGAGPPRVIFAGARATPVLAWDANINGGYLGDRFTLGGLVFAIDPARRARAGLMAGLAFGADLRLAWGPGRYLDLQAGGEALWSPEHRMGRAAAGASACLRGHLRGWTFGDLCASASHGWRVLSRGGTATVSAGLATLVTAGPAHHELSLRLARLTQPEGPQTEATLGWSAVWPMATTELSLSVLSAVTDATVPRRRAAFAIRWLAAGRPVSLGLHWQEAGGGMLVGRPREDRTLALSLGLQPRPGLTVELVHQVNRSTHDLFSDRRTGISLRLRR